MTSKSALALGAACLYAGIVTMAIQVPSDANGLIAHSITKSCLSKSIDLRANGRCTGAGVSQHATSQMCAR